MAIDPTDKSDLRLPEDFRFLAEQLASDAAYLEETFPANAPRNWRRAFATVVAQKSVAQKPQPARVTARRKANARDRLPVRAFGSVVAAAVVAVVLVGWYGVDARDGSPRRSSPSAASREGAETREPGRLIPAGVLSGFDTFLGTPAPQRPPVTQMPADDFNVYFSEVEQEAIIDVLNKYKIREPNVRY